MHRLTLGLAAASLFTQVAPAQVTPERLVKADPANWLTYSGTYSGQRHSALRQINTANVSGLRPVWVHQMDLNHKLETSPLVIDGIMYITEPPSNVTALDARTGRPFWTYRRPQPPDSRLCCGLVNRGAAAIGDLIVVGTVDAHLVALDARTGAVRWDRVVEDYRQGYSITAAPLAVKDKIIVGVAGGELGIRGFVDAYDAATGRRVWRFYTVPEPGQTGGDTWGGDSWKTGGAPTWLTGTYDPALNLLYWATGNPGPDWNGDSRPGDNLYSDCVLALNPDTGKLVWHFQFMPHDEFDWDANQIPVLVDTPAEKLLVTANRNGFYYVLDRVTGKFLKSMPFVKQNWAERIDEKGRPVRKPGITPSPSGVTVYPGVNGGTNWFSPAYSPATQLFYVAAREEGSVVFKNEVVRRPGDWFTGGGWRKIVDDPRTGAIRALHVRTGELAWEFKLSQPPWAGLLSTAGGLLFGSTDEGDFFALEAAKGSLLWRFPAGGRMYANPITFGADGDQYVAIASGQAIFCFGLK